MSVKAANAAAAGNQAVPPSDTIDTKACTQMAATAIVLYTSEFLELKSGWELGRTVGVCR